MWIELIGFVATLLILVAMSFRTDSFKGDVIMRVLNMIGSAVFAVYGFLLPAWSTAILNTVLVFVNAWHIGSLYKHHKEDLAKAANEETTEVAKTETTEQK